MCETTQAQSESQVRRKNVRKAKTDLVRTFSHVKPRRSNRKTHSTAYHQRKEAMPNEVWGNEKKIKEKKDRAKKRASYSVKPNVRITCNRAE